MYEYKAKVVRVIDGDSCEIEADLGFHVSFRTRCRLAEINTPELRDPDPELREKALKAADRLRELVSNPNVLIRSYKPFKGDKFGRFLILIINAVGVNVNDQLLSEGLAEPYS